MLSYRVSRSRSGTTAAFANDSEALKSPAVFLEKRKGREVSQVLQEALGSHERDRMGPEEIDQEMPVKRRRLGTARGEMSNHGFLVL